MSRIGNIEIVMFFSEDCGIIDTMFMMCRTTMNSLEDIKIDFHNSVTHCTTLPIN